MPLGGFLPNRPLVNVLVIVAATAVIWLGSGWLEESAEHLSAYYGLPAVVQGSIIVAVGSSFPELASVVFTALAGTFNMGVGAIVGSAIFNILVIPALAGIASDGHLETNRTIVYKEAQFYMIAVSAMVVTFALAVIYLPVPNGPALAGQLTRPLALLPLLLYALYLFIQWQDVSDHDAPDTPDHIAVGREWLRLGAGLLLILVAVEQLVSGVEALGHTFGIPEFLAGVTIVAAATSLPDTLVSVRTARSDRGITSLGNVLGSNTFDLLVAIPIGVLIVGATTIDFAVAVPMLGVLTLATVLLFTFLRTDLSVTGFEAYTLLAAYALFVAWVVAETVGVTHLIKGV
ncbi:MAG: sodium:calcium antiporter [Halopenitus sp.]